MKKGLAFYGVIDFWENRQRIIELYNEMDIEDKEIYKMYVYSLPFMEDDKKDLIWDCINGYIESQLILGSVYRKAKEKVERRKRNEIYYTDEII